jgi:hypothetical protein
MKESRPTSTYKERSKAKSNWGQRTDYKDKKNNYQGKFITDSLWHIIKRFDHLIETTNTKAALIIAFNTFILGGIVLKWGELLPQNPLWLIIAGSIILAAAAGACVVSLFFTFRAIAPYLRSHNYRSNVFFKDIKEHGEPEEYHKEMTGLTTDHLTRDLSFQVHIIAGGMSKKFKCLEDAVHAILYAQLPALLLFVVVRFMAFFVN